jgi:hypothetical protein
MILRISGNLRRGNFRVKPMGVRRSKFGTAAALPLDDAELAVERVLDEAAAPMRGPPPGRHGTG